MLKKIVECNDHIQLIKKYYISLILHDKTSFNDTSELLFKNKTVLTLDNNIENLEIGEVFTRYIFYLLDKNKKVNNSSKKDWYKDIIPSKFKSGVDPDTLNSDINIWPFQVQNFILIISIL